MFEKDEPLETKEETQARIERQRLSIFKYYNDPSVPKSSTKEKVITLKELQQRNIDDYKARHKL